MIRTFLALELPDHIKEAAHSIQQEMDFKGLKLVQPGLVHITLKFRGDIPESQVSPITDALVRVDFPCSLPGLRAWACSQNPLA